MCNPKIALPRFHPPEGLRDYLQRSNANSYSTPPSVQTPPTTYPAYHHTLPPPPLFIIRGFRESVRILDSHPSSAISSSALLFSSICLNSEQIVHHLIFRLSDASQCRVVSKLSTLSLPSILYSLTGRNRSEHNWRALLLSLSQLHTTLCCKDGETLYG